MSGNETAAGDFAISRVFEAPRDLVWQSFTEPERIEQWWGPKGFTVIAVKMDLRIGGICHYGMTAPDGTVMWGKFTYREIVPYRRLVFINSFSDRKGGVTRHPMVPTWPLYLVTTFTFEDEPDDKTRFGVRSTAYKATEEEQMTFDSPAMRDSMTKGWGGTLDQLAAYLATAKQGA